MLDAVFPADPFEDMDEEAAVLAARGAATA